jgi:hypothetical protein
MTLRFPNQSRSFDDKRNRVRFWGYDSAVEISFFVEADALQKLSPEMSSTEDGSLKAFDAARDRHNEHTAEYLLGMPLVADYLQQGLDALSISCEDIEKEHL